MGGKRGANDDDLWEILPASSLRLDSLMATGQASAQECAACGDGRSAAADFIVEIVRLTGSFEVRSPSGFWSAFEAARTSRGDFGLSGKRSPLCAACSLKVRRAVASKAEAIKLLEEAVKLDPRNDAAKRNLAALKGE